VLIGVRITAQFLCWSGTSDRGKIIFVTNGRIRIRRSKSEIFKFHSEFLSQKTTRHHQDSSYK
jgi:hypothetical protein